MPDSSNIIKEKIFTGKKALSNNSIDLAIQTFQEALNTSIPKDSSQNSLLGIAQAYLLLALGTKGTQEDNSTAILMTEALNLLPSETNKLEAYIFILMDIGKGLQKISFFKSSSIVFKTTLQFAQTQGAAERDIKLISIISRNLAFSYQKRGKIKPAAKLYRIAADLEQKPEDAITLYRSSAFQYYKAGMKDEALNIFQTAFDKAGILQQTDLQNEIAGFQGEISFEIFQTRDPSDLSSPDLEYLDLAHEKFTFLNDLDWLARIENERLLLSTQTKDKISDSEKIIHSEASLSENQPPVEIPISNTITFGEKSIEMNVPSVQNSSLFSKSAMEFLNESTRMLNNFAKLTSENIEFEEEIDELRLADKALSDDSFTGNSYDRLFSRSEKSISTEDSIKSNIQSDNSIPSAIEQETPITAAPKLSEVSNRLQQAGWIVQTNDISNKAKNPEPDIIAEKGLVRKKRKMIFFAEDVSDAEICSFLLQSSSETGEKFVFLLSGDPKNANISKKVKLVTRVDQIF
ncbi:MAG: hypothetical protein ACXADY_14145 [Candidatus Hodarchaeales archaeon]|jgi:tetratricopeptide (TPR) repeat protein